MECKWFKESSENKQKTELIDTLWNVNEIEEETEDYEEMELIDTLWNVNMGIMDNRIRTTKN